MYHEDYHIDSGKNQIYIYLKNKTIRKKHSDDVPPPKSNTQNPQKEVQKIKKEKI